MISRRTLYGLAAVMGSLLAAPLTLSLLACTPEEARGTAGARDVLLFAYLEFGPTEAVTLAADGATTRLVLVPEDASFTFTSSDPSVIAISPTGELTTGAPGEVDLIASDETGEVDHVRVRVARAARVAVGAASESYGASASARVMPGFEQVLTLSRFAESGTPLMGHGAWEVTATGEIAVRATTEADSFAGLSSRGDFLVLTALDTGIGTLTVRTGVALETADFQVFAEGDVDEIRELYRQRVGGGSGSVAVRLGVSASSAGDVIAGASCRWTVEGAMIGLDAVEPDGTLVTDFWTEDDRFVAHCAIGSVTQSFEVILADLPN